MSALAYADHRADPGAWARALGVSREACELLLASDFIDLHCDLEVPVRLIGYRPEVHHGIGSGVRPLIGHTDYPRIREAGLTGVVYDIATNPARPAGNRLITTIRNVEAAIARISAHPDDFEVVTDRAGYDRARAAGKTAMWISLQGGNAVSADPDVLDGPLGRTLHRITLVHLTISDLGGTSSPLGGDRGLTELGRRVIDRCNANRVLVDLAHTGRRTFWEALEAHASDVPPIVSHTGLDEVRRHWRNVDDRQVRAIVDRGGVVGVMYQSNFLAPVLWSCSRAAIVAHLAHVVERFGEDYAAIGTDYDGMIVPPHDLLDVTHHPLLVQDMLDRGWSPERIGKILGGNYLRVVGQVRPPT
ncbi:MAG: membrane dipeptidase [Myxococcota bacterium]